ncbi:MAG: putative quinol monooxygenase [Pseudomonadota bacterium]
MIVVEGTFRIKDLEATRPAMERMIEASRAEDGCVDYAYAQDLLDPHLMRVTELWRDRATFKAHLETPHLAAWRAEWDALGISDRDLRIYDAEPKPL